MAENPEIDGYSDLTRIAKGGFGIVYRARQDRHGRVVALKVLDIEALDERARQRFERECVAMGSLSWHPNVVVLHDSGVTAAGRPWLAMEFLDAGSLGDRLRDGPLAWTDAVAAGVQVAGALGAAHAAGTLHRDLKPENLLVGPFGEIKLGDFGIAAVEGAARTTTGHASFTAAHVAPEFLRGQRPDERADLYGLGSTLYTLIAGTPPLAGDDDEPFASVMARVLSEPAPRLATVPDALADLVAQSLAKEPDARPQTAAEFGRALQAVQAAAGHDVTDLRVDRVTPGRPKRDARPTRRVPASPSGPPPPPVRPAAASTPKTDRSSGIRGPRRTKRAVLVVAGAIVASVALVGGWWTIDGREEPTQDLGSDDTVSVTTTSSTTTTTLAASDPATVAVSVLNRNGVGGTANAAVDVLVQAGFTASVPGENVEPSEASVVYFDPSNGGTVADAEAVAAVLDLPPSVVEPLPARVPFDTLGGAIVVLLGIDRALDLA